MTRDFTISVYHRLLNALREAGYAGVAFRDFVEAPDLWSKVVILRHDVDRLPGNAIRVAAMQTEFGFRGSYYFRALPCSHDESAIQRIVNLGHEIGYHYEEWSLSRGNLKVARKLFEVNLARLRRLYPVVTMCMHGSPTSRYDNRHMWEMLDYRDYGIIAEPYFDINYDDLFYLTDTGRGWNRWDVSVRDRAGMSSNHFKFGSTLELIEMIEKDELPYRIMMNIHPQRWEDSFLAWSRELVVQSIKNVIKKRLVIGKKSS